MGKVVRFSLAFQSRNIGGLNPEDSCVLIDCLLQQTQQLLYASHSEDNGKKNPV